MSNPEAGKAILEQLHSRGIDLHIDDFGTGYSSLEALHRFPIQGLKLDRSFVAGLGCDLRSSEITRTIIMLGQRLGMEVIAEGVETAEQLALLGELNCASGQGYLLARPLDEEALDALLAAPALADVSSGGR
jgi:EAL domain-containing protein (putative c-di-GMP-specific phosphodiesterase class I)